MPPLLESAAALALTASAASGALAYASLYPTSQLLGPILTAPRNRPQDFALTFDDGPNPLATPQLLDVLARHNVRATFFLIGQNVLREPALTRTIAAAGHAIGNHTMHHPWLTFCSPTRIRAELTDCNHALEDTLGAPVTLFRPPHGARSLTVLRAALALALTPVNWNIIAGDWEPVSSTIILHRIARDFAANRAHRRATNLVLHDGPHTAPRLPTVSAVDRLLTSLAPLNLTYVTPDAWIE